VVGGDLILRFFFFLLRLIGRSLLGYFLVRYYSSLCGWYVAMAESFLEWAGANMQWRYASDIWCTAIR
jgi:hypothetical protein